MRRLYLLLTMFVGLSAVMLAAGAKVLAVQGYSLFSNEDAEAVDAISMNDIQMGPLSTQKLVISYTKVKEVSSMTMLLTLPEGLTATKIERNSERIDRSEFGLSLDRVAKGWLITLTGSAGEPIYGDEGELMTVTIKSDANFFTKGKAVLTDITLSTVNNEKIKLDDVEANIQPNNVGSFSFDKESITLSANEWTRLEVAYDNITYIMGMQATLELPQGIEIKKTPRGKISFEYGDRLPEDVSIQYNEVDGNLELAIAGTNGSSLGMSGMLFAIEVKGVVIGTQAITLNNVYVSLLNGKDVPNDGVSMTVVGVPETTVSTSYSKDNSTCVISAEPTQEGTSFIFSIDGGEEFMELPAEGYTLAWLEALADEWGINLYNVIVREVIYDEEWNMTVVAAGFEQVHLSKPLPKAEDGEYYVKNVATGQFLNGANSWGTKASLTPAGQLMTLESVEGGYTLDTHISNGGNNHYLGSNGFVDAAPVALEIEYADNDAFTIACGGKYLTYEVVDGQNQANFSSDEMNEASMWVFVTKEDIITSLGAASAENSVDLTSLLGDPGFGRNNQAFDQWEGDKPGKGGANENMNAEKWGGNSQTFDSHQTIEVPNGIYKVSVQGYYRYNNTTDNTNDIAAAAHADGSEVIYSYFYANDVEMPLVSIADEASVEIAGSMPFSQGAASEAFGKGAYNNELIVVVTNGTLTVGVKKTEHIGCDWTVWDNFQIQCLGTTDDIELDAEYDAEGLFANVTVDYTPAEGNILVYAIDGEVMGMVEDGKVMVAPAPGQFVNGAAHLVLTIYEMPAETAGDMTTVVATGTIELDFAQAISSLPGESDENPIVLVDGDSEMIAATEVGTDEAGYAHFTYTATEAGTFVFSCGYEIKAFGAEDGMEAVESTIAPKWVYGKAVEAGETVTFSAYLPQSYEGFAFDAETGEVIEGETELYDIDSYIFTAGVEVEGVIDYCDLTADMFCRWDGFGAGANVTEANVGEFHIGESSGLPYGHGNVEGSAYADLTPWSVLALTVTEGTPRLLLNRQGMDNSGDFIEINSASSPYVTVAENIWYINLAKITEEAGYVHLNCIKGANWQNCTITEAKLLTSDINDVVVGVASVKANVENGVVFDLTGRRVSTVAKGGIYIVNGKKILVNK